jgi:hypothetical protein
MILRSILLLAGVMLTGSCAARASLDVLDSRAEFGRAGWKYYRGSVCDFRAHENVCVSGVDDGRRLDVTPAIAKVLVEKWPGVKNTCDESRPRIRAEYSGDYSRCAHCAAPGLSTRVGIAFVRVESQNGWEADATWSDTIGGTAEQVAERFGEALATMLRDAVSPSCARPPNEPLETSGTDVVPRCNLFRNELVIRRSQVACRSRRRRWG